MNIKIFTLLSISIFLGFGAYASDESESDLKRLMADESIEGISANVQRQLEDGGLSTMDAAQVIRGLAEEWSACAVDSMVAIAEEQGLDTDAFLAEAKEAFQNKAGDDFSEVLNQFELERRLSKCMEDALANAGVQIE